MRQHQTPSQATAPAQAPQQAVEGATQSNQALQEQMQAAMSENLAVVKPVAKLGMGVAKTVKKSQKAHKANNSNQAMKQELGKDRTRDAVFAGLKAPTAGGKGAAAVLSHSLVNNEAAGPVGDATKVYKGAVKAAEGTANAIRFQQGVSNTREQQAAAEERGDVLALGLQGAKRGMAQSRNDATWDAAHGAIMAADGAVGLASYADASGTAMAARGVTSAANKGMKYGLLGYRSARDGRNYEKIEEMRAAADNGDAEAMKWLLQNDPQMGSAQMLMHALNGSEEEGADGKSDKQFAQEAIQQSFGMAQNDNMFEWEQEKVDEEGNTKTKQKQAKLKTFDELYEHRTGQKIDQGLGKKQAFVYKKMKPVLDAGSKAKKKAKGLFKRNKKNAPAPQMDRDAMIEAMNQGNRIRDTKAEEEQLREEGADNNTIENLWDTSGVSAEAMPNRMRPEVREYKKVRRFRAEQTLKQHQKKAKKKAKNDGNEDYEMVNTGNAEADVRSLVDGNRSGLKRKKVAKTKEAKERLGLTTMKTGDLDDRLYRDMAEVLAEQRGEQA